MSAAAEHALRTLGEKLAEHAKGVPDMSGGYVLKALAAAHIETANQLQAEREAMDARLYENATGFRYDPKGKAASAR
jgi:hypothetical protein